MKVYTVILTTGQSFEIQASSVSTQNGTEKSRYVFLDDAMEPIAEFALESVAGWAEKNHARVSPPDMRPPLK